MSKRKILSAILALAMVFSAVSAFTFPITASATVPSDVVWKQVYFQDFEDGGAKPEFTKSGTSSAWASNGAYGHDFTNADQYNLGDYTLILKQRKNITTKATMKTDPNDSDTPINGKVPAGKLGKVKISFNIAKLFEDGTATRISIVGDDSNGAQQEQTNILIIKRYSLYYTADYSSLDWSNSTWHMVDIYVDCENDVYDFVYDGTTILQNQALDYDYASIYGVNFNADTGSSSAKTGDYYTYLDNISFSVIADTYPVTLNTNGGTVNAGNITSYTETVGATLPTNVTKSGATFAGWYEQSSFTGSAVTAIPTSATGSKTFYAKWDASVTLKKNGGTVNAGDISQYTEGVGATLPTDITRDGYTFGGWYDNSSFTGSAVTSIPSNATGNKTFYAKWTTNGTWDKVLDVTFESGNEATGLPWSSYFTEDASGRSRVPDDVDYTNNTGDNLGSTVKRIAGTYGTGRTLVLNGASSPLYTGNASAGKADIVRISFDLAQNTSDEKEAHIQLVGSVGGETVTTGMDYGKNRFLFVKSGRLYAQDQDSDNAQNLHSFNTSKWHKIVVEINCMTDTYDVYVYDGGEYDGRFAAGYSLPFDFDAIYGISVTAKKGGTDGVTQQVFVDNVRYYVPGDNASITNESYSAGTLTATVNVDANPDFGNTIALAAYYDAALKNFAGVALADVTGASSYNMTITNLTQSPYIIKALIWNLEDLSPSAGYAEKTLE